MSDINSLLIHIDIKIKSGDLASAKSDILQIYNKLKDLSLHERVKKRELILEVAILSRRLSLFKEGLFLLRPFIHPKSRNHVISLASEKTEYAALLYRLGLFAEGDHLIKDIFSKDYFKVDLIKGFSHISRWNYEESLICLKKFIEQDSISNYDKLVAKVNILFGYAFLENIPEGEKLSEELIAETQTTNSSLLYANTLEAASEIQQLKNNSNKALSYIEKAKQHMKDSGSVDYFLIEKQTLFLKLRTEGFNEENAFNFERFKQESYRRKRFETLRELAFLKSTLTNDFELAKYVYAGTPYIGFRKKIAKYFPEIKYIKDHEIKNTTHSSIKVGMDMSEIQKKMNPLPFKLLTTILDDYFLPKKIEDIFNSLYHHENFNYDSAKDRVYQVVKRLRLEIKLNRLPLKIVMKDNFYLLKLTSRYQSALKRQINNNYLSSEVILILNSLKRKRIAVSSLENMTSSELSKKLGKSQRTAQRMLRVLKTNQLF